MIVGCLASRGTGVYRRIIIDPGVWHSTICEGGRRFMASWVKEEENASENRKRKR